MINHRQPAVARYHGYGVGVGNMVMAANSVRWGGDREDDDDDDDDDDLC